LAYIYISNLKVNKILIIRDYKETNINIVWNIFNYFFNNDGSKKILKSNERERLDIVYLKS
jgi:hypothetical protein